MLKRISLGLLAALAIAIALTREAWMWGATSLECQYGRVWVRFLYPRLWCRRNWPFIQVRWVHKCPASGEDCLDYDDCKNRNYCHLK